MTTPKRQTESFTQRMNRQERRKEMIRKAKAWFVENRPGYTPVDNGKSVKADRCHWCGQRSLLRHYTPDKTEIVRVCLRRFDTRKDSDCGYSDKVPVGYDRFVKKEVKKEDAPTENAASAAV